MILDQITISVDFQSQHFINFITKALNVMMNIDYLNENRAYIHTEFYRILRSPVRGRSTSWPIWPNDFGISWSLLISTPNMNIYANDIDLSALEIFCGRTFWWLPDENMDIQNLLYNEDEPPAVYWSKNQWAQTCRDKQREYPLEIRQVLARRHDHCILEWTQNNPNEKMRMAQIRQREHPHSWYGKTDRGKWKF